MFFSLLQYVHPTSRNVRLKSKPAHRLETTGKQTIITIPSSLTSFMFRCCDVWWGKKQNCPKNKTVSFTGRKGSFFLLRRGHTRTDINDKILLLRQRMDGQNPIPYEPELPIGGPISLYEACFISPQKPHPVPSERRKKTHETVADTREAGNKHSHWQGEKGKKAKSPARRLNDMQMR